VLACISLWPDHRSSPLYLAFSWIGEAFVYGREYWAWCLPLLRKNLRHLFVSVTLR